MAIMDEVNHTVNTSTERFEEDAYVGTIYTAVPVVIVELNGADPGSTDRRLKSFVPPYMETILDPVISRFIAKLQVHLNHSEEVIVGSQASI